MGKVIGSGNICIARLSDGYSSAVVMLYRSAEGTEKPLRLLYNFSSGSLTSGVDGKTLTECLNGWSTERGAESHYAISASVRSTEEYGTIESSSWSDSFLIAEKGETIVSVTLYQRAENVPERPSSALTYNFYTGEVTGSLGAWSTSIPDYTEYPLWSISATASAVLDGGTETDEISASEWSAPKKVAEDGKSPIEIFLSAYSYVFPADEDGLVKSSEYEKFSVEVLAVRGGKAVEFTMSAELTGITNVNVSGNVVSASSSSVMLGDSASVKLSITAEGETYIKTISLAKAKQSKPTELWFAWSKSETIFTPADSNFWIVGTSFIYFNNSLIGNIPFTNSWVNNWAEIEAAKTEEYCYLWCKTSESGTPFLFTGATGKTGAYEKKQYCLSDSKVEAPTEGWTEDMPNIVNSVQYLWIRYKLVPTGGNEDEIEWSDPVVSNVGIAVTESKISLNADKTKFIVSGEEIQADGTIIKDGGITAQQVDADKFFGKEFVVATGGSIESQSHKDDSSKGFKFWESGHIDANDITLGDDVVFGGTMQNDVIKTVKEAKTGTAITSPGWESGNVSGWFVNEASSALSAYNGQSCSCTINGTAAYKPTENIYQDGNNFKIGNGPLRIVVKGNSFYVGYIEYTAKPTTYNGRTFWAQWEIEHTACSYSADTYFTDTVVITLDSDSSVVLNTANLPQYAPWPGTGLSKGQSGLISSGAFKGTNVAGYNFIATETTIIVKGVGSITQGEMYTSSNWPSYSITPFNEALGVHVTDLYPYEDESGNYTGSGNIGDYSHPFNEVWGSKLCGIYPANSVYMGLDGTDPNNFLGGTWTSIGTTIMASKTIYIWLRTA